MRGSELRVDSHTPLSPAAVALTIPASSGIGTEMDGMVMEQQAGFWREEGTEACQWPISYMSRESFKKGEYLFKAGDRAEKLYYIGKGVIKLPELNCFVKAGQVIGEMGIFSPGKERTASAIAEEEVEAYTMGCDDVKRLLARDPALGINMIQLSIKRMIDNLKAETAARERINTELRVAREIQTSMLPRTFPPFPDRKEFEIYAMMEPAKEVGGDLYDFFFIDEKRLCVIVGDVSGKGVPAALFMAISRALLKSEAKRGYPASEIIARVNNLITPDNPECMFVTVFCLILNTETGEAECCSGGHNAPLLCTNDGAIEYLEAPCGLVVGFEVNTTYRSRTITLKPGEMLLLYTDGVTEAQNSRSECFSENRLKDCVLALRNRELREIVDGVKQEIALHAQTQPQSDDITMLALKYWGPAKNAKSRI
jgi:serine phosphatase RsbU (regulator of sigma subunit)